MQTASIDLTEIENPIFKPEVIVTDSIMDTIEYVNSQHSPFKNTQDYSLSRKEKVVANAQVYFNTRRNNEMEIHSLRCIFQDDFVPFNSIFTSSGDDDSLDSSDSSEQYIFISSWNLICPCWRLQDPYENGIIRNTFLRFENMKEYPPLLSIEENYLPLPYQEFKKTQKPVKSQQFKFPVSKTVPITEIYSSRNVSSVNTKFKYPINNVTDQLPTIPSVERAFKSKPLPNYTYDSNKAPVKNPLMDFMMISSENDNFKYSVPKLETTKSEKGKDLQDSVIYLQRIPGTVSDTLYEENNGAMKSKALVKPTKDMTCAPSTNFSNTNLMLVGNTLVAANDSIDNETLSVSPTISTYSFGWASNVNFNTTGSPDFKIESGGRTANLSLKPKEKKVTFVFSEVNKSEESDSLEDATSEEANSKEWKSLEIVRKKVEIAEADSLDEYDSVEDENVEEVKSKKSDNFENEIAEADVIHKKVFENQNKITTAPMKKDAKKERLMFSWLKKHPIKQSVLLKYLFRGIGFGIASFGTKPKRLGFSTDENSMKRKISFKFKNKFMPNKVIPIDPRSFGKSVVHQKLFKKRALRRNPKSQKIIQNFEAQNFLPVKILKHNRVVPLPKITDPE